MAAGVHSHIKDSLVLLTWNVGSLSLHMDSVVTLLVSQAPHVFCLQEARILPHQYRAFQCTLRSLGYVSHQTRSHNLVTIWRRGLNFAPFCARLPGAG